MNFTKEKKTLLEIASKVDCPFVVQKHYWSETTYKIITSFEKGKKPGAYIIKSIPVSAYFEWLFYPETKRVNGYKQPIWYLISENVEWFLNQNPVLVSEENKKFYRRERKEISELVQELTETKKYSQRAFYIPRTKQR